ncbi:MAG: S1 family peptidase [Solirubrobacteraceae bacterium]
MTVRRITNVGRATTNRPLAVACALLVGVLVAGLATAVAGAQGARPARANVKSHAGERGLGRHRYGPHAHAAIVNGTQISIAQAPWQVVVFANADGGLLCGGSIISPTQILTAAHCVFDETTNQPIAASDFEVLAGTANFNATESTMQERLVSSVRPHPYYNPTEPLPRADDVAVLTLATPLTETAGSVQKLALSGQGVGPAEGAGVGLTGFGLEDSSPQELTGRLNAITMTTAFARRCGGESDALYICASTPSGSLCNGDSGSALTLPGSPATAIGVTDTVQVIGGVACRPGAVGGFANLAAPEIAEFVRGIESPPRAPRGGGDIAISNVTTVGGTVTCLPGTWSNSPTFTFVFSDGPGGPLLQSGPGQTYQLTAADIGRTITCEVRAANAGGTGVARIGLVLAVTAAPGAVSGATQPGLAPQAIVPPQKVSRASLRATSVSVSKSGAALVKLACTGLGQCSGRLSLTVRRTFVKHGRRSVRVVSLASTTSFSLAQGRTYSVRLWLTPQGRALLASGHGHLTARLTLVQLRPPPTLRKTSTVHLVRAKKS